MVRHCTLLFHRLKDHQRVSALRVLHELGAAESLNARDEDGATPAYIAAHNGHTEALKVLEEHEAQAK